MTSIIQPSRRRSVPAVVALAALTALLTMGSGSSFARTLIIAPSAPPPLRTEVVPVARPGRVWDAGHWRWNGRRYVWVVGHWRPVVVGARWVPGGWGPRGRGYGWTEGHWVR